MYAPQRIESAAEACALDNAHLADIKSEEEQEFIGSWLQDINADDTWFGLHKVNGEWVWSDDSSVEFDAWARPIEPDNTDVCVRLVKSRSYQWGDLWCDYSRSYICERNGITLYIYIIIYFQICCNYKWRFVYVTLNKNTCIL